ncbi:MAG: amino acid adenylation domain-containing protein [Gammaproteobacteria bacterium]|nr:amino acid adenylation domain-containing protein [Gammaproteobacteria bacterium]
MFKNFIKLFEIQVNLHPEKSAIVFHEKQITYRELMQRVNDLAQHLTGFVRNSEEIIPLILERNPDIIISMLAILKIGCAFLPISPITPCLRIKFILEDTQASLVVCNRHLDPNIRKNINVINPSGVKSTSSLACTSITPNNLAYVMYTSGSTGNPKGVLIEHHSMMNLFLSLISKMAISENDKILALTDYTFDISLIELLMPLLKGATILLTEQGTVADGVKIRQYLKKNTITCMQATPLSWEILLKQGWKNDGRMKILVGGEKFSTRLAELLRYEKGNIWNMYGPTETSMWSMFNPINSPLLTESVPVGKPLTNTVIEILDTHLNNVGIGVQGELYIGGKGLARGYLNNQKLTDEKFIFHPQTKIRLYKTGDLVIAHDEETLCYTGRIDEQLKFGGIRIEAGEIESVIEQEPLVKKAVVKMHEMEGYYKSLAAYVEIDEESVFSKGLQEAHFDMSCFLKNIYDETYLHAEDYEQGTMNNCGWQSSFTGELFSIEELSESYQWIRKFIDEANLSDVLEVGCGTGSLLLEYINKADKCTIVEISSKAIDYVKNRLTEHQAKKITFQNESVLNITNDQQYSCVIINSVIQYLPSIDAVLTTLTQLITATRADGSIIIGDVRSLELMDVYLLEKIRTNSTDADSLHSNLSSFYYKSRDTEVVLSPNFFYALKDRFKEISHVDISVKHGVYRNELNYFRYDVILHINKTVVYQSPIAIQYTPLLTVENLKETIQLNPNKSLIIKTLPNLHMQEFLGVFNRDIPHHLAFPSLSLKIHDDEIKHINALINFELKTYDKFIAYGDKNPINTIDLYLHPRTEQLVRCPDKIKYKNYRAYCREPFNPWLQKYCFDRIKLKISQNVVSWVHPSVYVWVEKWPLSINGKLDKKKLALPLRTDSRQAEANTLEQLQIIWQNITGDDALVDKEFWVHGISSLSLYFFLATINEAFPVNINYHEFRDYDTLVKLSEYIDLNIKATSKTNYLNHDMETLLEEKDEKRNYKVNVNETHIAER